MLFQKKKPDLLHLELMAWYYMHIGVVKNPQKKIRQIGLRPRFVELSNFFIKDNRSMKTQENQVRLLKRICSRPGCERQVRKKRARICCYCRNKTKILSL
jgi:hypothetical protein